MRVLSSRQFQKKGLALLGEEGFDALIRFLVDYPESGDVIPGTGGLRKLRWGRPGMGVRGGAKVITCLFLHKEIVFALSIYSKSKTKNLDSKALHDLSKQAEALKRLWED